MTVTQPSYYQKNKKARLEYAHNYNKANRASVNQKALDYRNKNRDKAIAYSRKYNKINRVSLNAKAKAKREADKLKENK